jgi:acylglycerol lipase
MMAIVRALAAAELAACAYGALAALAQEIHNPDYQRALLDDPLNMQQFTLGYAYGALASTDEAMAGAEKLEVPTLLLYGEHDIVVAAVDFREASRTVAGPKRVIVYPEGYHALVVDIQRENVFRDIAAWIEGQAE